MSYISRLFIIILISFTGELMNHIIPLPIPGSIYGFVILFILLCTKIIKLDYIKPVTDFLLNIMPVTFIAPGVALMITASELQQMLIPILLSVSVSTVIVMAVAGIVSEKILTKKKRGNNNV